MHPRDRLPLLVGRRPGVLVNPPDLEPHMAVRIAVVDIDQGLGCPHRDGQLLREFAGKRFRDGLSHVDLAAREFPQSTLMKVIVAPADEHLAACVRDHTHSDTQHTGFGWRAQLRYSALMRT